MHPIEQALRKVATPERASVNMRFFKTGKGQYGEGDYFLGVTVPDSRMVARQFIDTPLSALKSALQSKWHEVRLTALLVLVERYKSKHTTEKEKQSIVEFYLNHLPYVNNWDLVDLSADKILGEYCLAFPSHKKQLYTLANSPQLWKKRIGIISTFAFIRKNQFEDTKKISVLLMQDKHDLMHKAVGWMLREMGKRDEKELVQFLKQHYKQMPRTMLRYAIEKFPEATRKKYLLGEI